MKLEELKMAFETLATPVPMRHAWVSEQQWTDAATVVRDEGGRLLALWASAAGPGDVHQICAVYVTLEGAIWLSLPVLPEDGQLLYPDLSASFPAALRMQRAAADLSGVHARVATDTRAWLNHGAWPASHHPLQHNAMQWPALAATELVNYPFVKVEGDGVHEIAVGPVHAGVIEPGHFRFSVVGERVLRLEQRLGYTHKGIERRMTQLEPVQAARLAGRVSGDSPVA